LEWLTNILGRPPVCPWKKVTENAGVVVDTSAAIVGNPERILGQQLWPRKPHIKYDHHFI